MTIKVGDLVVDGEGDRGVVRRLGHLRAQARPNYILADPKIERISFASERDTALVEWETLNGVTVTMQASWESVADLRSAKGY